MTGLYARTKLTEKMETYALKPAYEHMISKLANKAPFLLTEEEYIELSA